MLKKKSGIPGPNSIIVRLCGGLGNQLWQYTAGLALYSQYIDAETPPEIWVDISHYKNGPTDRPLLLDRLFPDLRLCLDLSPEVENSHLLFKEPFYYVFNENFCSLPFNTILDGHFQHHRYFEMAKPWLKPNTNPIPLKYKNLDENYALVAVHIRRGDYLEQEHGIAPLEYYHAALQKAKKELINPYILFFSDDVDWAIKYLISYAQQLNLPCDFPDGDVLEDFSLTVHCTHFIVANSSLSLFAAMLGQKQNSILLAPQMWNLSQNINSTDYLLPKWQVPNYLFYQHVVPDLPIVSIIIPVYNTLQYLDRCLESVCLQTEQNIEIIIVDDASPDASWGLIQKYARRDPRIVKIRHEVSKHSGGARNTGIRAARGEWLMFLDSDDYIRKDTIEIFLKKANKYPDIKLLHCSALRVLERKGEIIFLWGSDEDTLICEPFAHYCEERSPYIGVCACIKIWKKELFNNISFPENMAYEDLDTISRLLSGLDKCLYISERLYYYQENKNSITSSMSKEKLQDLCKAFSLLHLWGLEQAVDRRLLLNNKIFIEINFYIDSLLENMESRTDYLEIFLKFFPKDLLAEYLSNKSRDVRRLQAESERLQAESERLQQNRWYRFGQLSRKRKIWIMGKVLSKKLGFYHLLRPFARIVKLCWKKL